MRQSKSKLIRRLLAFSSTRPRDLNPMERAQYRAVKGLYNTIPRPQRASFLDEVGPVKARMEAELNQKMAKVQQPS